jgi:hypothetical protein
MVRLHSESQTFSPTKFENEEFLGAPESVRTSVVADTQEKDEPITLKHIGDTPEEFQKRLSHCKTASNKGPHTLFSYREEGVPYSYAQSLEDTMSEREAQKIVP